jgi:hypothetical protein
MLKFLQTCDNRLMALMDEIGFWMQVRVGIRRFYLVPILTLVAIFIRYFRSGTVVPDPGDMAGGVIAFMVIMSIHFFAIHRKGSNTDDTTVNIAVEGVRSNPVYLLMRVLCFCMFVVLTTVLSLTLPWRIPLAFVDFFFLFYPMLIYQQEPPPKHEL